MGLESKDIKYTTVNGQRVALGQHEKQDGTMAITGEKNPMPMQLMGSILDKRDLAANKPAATTVPVGTTFWSVDTDPLAMKVEVSDGTKWTVME